MRIENDTTLIGEDLADICDFLARSPKKWRGDSSVTDNDGYQWTYNLSYAQAIRMATTGWPEGRERLAKLAMTPPERTKYMPVFDVAGERPDIDRYLTGDPRNMVSHTRKRIPRPIVRLLLNIGASAYVQGSQMTNFGVALVSLINQLESDGKRIEVDLVYNVMMSQGARCHVGWGVKAADQYLDLDQIAFACAHPAAFRRLGFALFERLAPQYEHYAYGRPLDTNESDLRELQAPADSIVIDGAWIWPRCHSAESARQALEELVK
jgi:hypothetical protein